MKKLKQILGVVTAFILANWLPIVGVAAAAVITGTGITAAVYQSNISNANKNVQFRCKYVPHGTEHKLKCIVSDYSKHLNAYLVLHSAA